MVSDGLIFRTPRVQRFDRDGWTLERPTGRTASLAGLPGATGAAFGRLANRAHACHRREGGGSGQGHS